MSPIKDYVGGLKWIIYDRPSAIDGKSFAIFDDIYDGFTRGEDTDSIYLDYAKAFD